MGDPHRNENRAVAFGLRWSSALPLRQFQCLEFEGPPDVAVTIAAPPVPARTELARWGTGAVCSDGYRFSADAEAIIDIFGADRIAVTPGENWTGEMPPHFFGTATAVILASRGLIPLHGTAVEIAGCAVLLCGRSGGGKSTIGAKLIALGGKLISDDLTALVMDPDSLPYVLAGRPGMRLHPDTAKSLSASLDCGTPVPALNGKLLVFPRRIASFERRLLAGVVMLDRDDAVLPLKLQILLLRSQIFRPRLMHLVPNAMERSKVTAEVARKIGVARMRELRVYDERTCLALAQQIFARCESPAHAA